MEVTRSSILTGQGKQAACRLDQAWLVQTSYCYLLPTGLSLPSIAEAKRHRPGSAAHLWSSSSGGRLTEGLLSSLTDTRRGGPVRYQCGEGQVQIRLSEERDLCRVLDVLGETIVHLFEAFADVREEAAAAEQQQQSGGRGGADEDDDDEEDHSDGEEAAEAKWGKRKWASGSKGGAHQAKSPARTPPHRRRNMTSRRREGTARFGHEYDTTR